MSAVNHENGEKIRITFFSDPMMGLAWQCLDLLEKLKDTYPNEIEIEMQSVMLVDHVFRFMTSDDWKEGPDHLFEQYNRRLQSIYNAESALGQRTIHMQHLRLFDAAHTSTDVLIKACLATAKISPEKKDAFLNEMRRQIIEEEVPMLHEENLVRLAEQFGISAPEFLKQLHSEETAEQFKENQNCFSRLGFTGLPAWKFSFKGHTVLSDQWMDFSACQTRIASLKNFAEENYY